MADIEREKADILNNKGKSLGYSGLDLPAPPYDTPLGLPPVSEEFQEKPDETDEEYIQRVLNSFRKSSVDSYIRQCRRIGVEPDPNVIKNILGNQ